METPSTPKLAFRSEALSAQRNKQQSEPPFAYPLSLRRLSWIGVAFSVSVALAMCFVRYTEYIQSEAVVRPAGDFTIYAAGQEGTIHLAPGISTGKRVSEGELLGWVSVAAAVLAANSLPDASLTRLEAKRDSLENAGKVSESAASANILAIDQQVEMTAQQEAQLAQRRTEIEQRVALKREELDRNAGLARDGYVSAQFLSNLRSELAGLRGDLSDVNQRALSLTQQRIALKQQAMQMRNQSTLDSERVQQDVAEVKSRLIAAESNRRAEIRAGRPLVVTAVHVDSGSYVLSDTPVITTSDADASEVVQCLLSARAAVGLAPGTTVRLRYAAFPYQYFGTFEGHVLSVDTSPWRGRDREGAASAPVDSQPLYRVVVLPSQQVIRTPEGSQRLLPGMQASVEIPKSRRTLGAWLLTPGRNL